jgi:predicted GNAT family N-acyltransferase
MFGGMGSAYEIVAKAPSNCSAAEICNFVALVEQGGEVAAGGLQQRVIGAANLAFLQLGGRLAGVAALKQPNAGYRARVASASGTALPQDSFVYELGWVFIAIEARGNGYALPLSQAALSLADGCGVFATSRIDNVAMHHALANLGFLPSGSPYPSQHGGHHLQLFTRVPPNNSARSFP